MFIYGIILLIIGGILGYGTKWLVDKFGFNMSESVTLLLILKLAGFVLAAVGFLMVINGEFPEKLKFIKIF